MRDLVVVITGAARGLGQAMALAAAGRGARVVAIDVSWADGAKSSATERVLPLVVDVRDAEACKAAVVQAQREFGSVDVLVNNAGIGMEQVTAAVLSRPVPFHEVPPAVWQRIVETNLNGAFHMASSVVPGMIARGSGRLINVLTSRDTMMRAGFSPYGPTKAALEAATVIWARELANTGVTVNGLLPGGPADTRMIPERHSIDRSTLIPPDVMVPPFVWLCSDAAREVTGMRLIAAAWNAAAAEPWAKAMSPAGM